MVDVIERDEGALLVLGRGAFTLDGQPAENPWELIARRFLQNGEEPTASEADTGDEDSVEVLAIEQATRQALVRAGAMLLLVDRERVLRRWATGGMAPSVHDLGIVSGRGVLLRHARGMSAITGDGARPLDCGRDRRHLFRLPRPASWPWSEMAYARSTGEGSDPMGA